MPAVRAKHSRFPSLDDASFLTEATREITYWSVTMASTTATDTGSRRRAQILDAATAVFARRGVQQARMDDIAAEISLSKPALYLYFESKGAIVAELMRRLFELEVADLKQLEQAPGTVAERLLAFDDLVQRQYRDLGVPASLFWEFYALALRERRARGLVRRYFAVIRERLEVLIGQGIAAGELRDVDPKTTALAILAVWEGLGLLWATEPRAIDWRRQADAALGLLLGGITRKQT
jgi:AcrR family transcriptional regulator